LKKRAFASLTALAIALTTVAVPFIPYSSPAVAFAAEKAPNYKDRSEIPDQYKWKLNHIYATVQDWEKDVNKVESMANAFTKHQGKLGSSADALVKAIEAWVAKQHRACRAPVRSLNHWKHYKRQRRAFRSRRLSGEPLH